MLHGKKESKNSEKIAKETFSNNSTGSNLPSIKIDESSLKDKLNIIDLVVISKFENSKSEIRRLINGKAIKINNEIILNEKTIIDKSFLIKIISNFQDITKNNTKIIEDWFIKYNIRSKKRIIILALSLIGYDTRIVYKNLKHYNSLITAYKSRYLTELTYVNQETLYTNIIKNLFKNLLTKS